MPSRLPALPRTVPTTAFRGTDVARSSDGLGWSVTRLEHRITPGAGASERALAFDTDVLILHRRPTRMWQELDGRAEDVTFRSGDAVLVPCACPARWSWDDPAETIVLAWPETGAAAPRLPPRPRLTDLAMGEACLWLQRVADAGRSADRLLADGLALHIGETLRRAAAGRDGKPPGPRDRPLDERRLAIATARIAATDSEGAPTIAELAALVGLSPAYFARAFRARAGIAPHAWWATLRLGRALAALQRPGSAMALAAIATATGFADQAHMTRAIRRATGLTPARLRAT